MSSRVPRPVVPTPMRRLVFHTIHNVSHPGVKGSQVKIGKHFVWPSLLKDVKQWTTQCLNCQKSKVHRHTLSLIHISEPTRLLSISYAVFCLKKKIKKKN